MSVPGGRARRIAALWGTDLVHHGPVGEPEQLLAEGYELLALDRPAATLLGSAGHPFRTVEDWIDPDGTSLADRYDEANRLTATLTARGRELVSTDGVDWLSEDYFTIEGLLQTASIATRLAGALRHHGVERLRLTTGQSFDPLAPNRAPQPLFAAILMRLLGESLEPTPLPDLPPVMRLRRRISASPAGPGLRSIRALIDRLRFRRAARQARRQVDPERLTIAMLSLRELDRSGSLLRALSATSGDALQVVPWMNARELTREAGELSGLPWLPTPPMEQGRRSIERRLRTGVGEAVAATPLGELEPIRRELTEALSALAARWAAHADRLRWAVRALELLAPRLVIASREDIEYQVPIEAARLLGVPTLTIPHGVVHWVPPHRLMPRPRVVHLSGVMNPTAPPDTLRVTGEALVTYEYPRRREAVGSSALTGRGINVLVLTDGFGRTNHPSVDLRAHQRALRMVVSALRASGSDVHAFLKPHPAMSEQAEPLLLEADELERLPALPRSADLIEALERSDLVIAVNCLGSALVHTVMAGVPVVRVSTAALLDTTHASDPATALHGGHAWQRFWDQHLESATDEAELTAVLRGMLDDPDSARGLTARSRAAAAILRPSGADEPIVDIIEELLARRRG